MGKWVATAIGVLMFVAGALWTAQGLGYVGGSSMTGSRTWALVGPAFAGLGIALVIVAHQRRH